MDFSNKKNASAIAKTVNDERKLEPKGKAIVAKSTPVVDMLDDEIADELLEGGSMASKLGTQNLEKDSVIVKGDSSHSDVKPSKNFLAESYVMPSPVLPIVRLTDEFRKNFRSRSIIGNLTQNKPSKMDPPSPTALPRITRTRNHQNKTKLPCNAGDSENEPGTFSREDSIEMNGLPPPDLVKRKSTKRGMTEIKGKSKKMLSTKDVEEKDLSPKKNAFKGKKKTVFADEPYLETDDVG